MNQPKPWRICPKNPPVQMKKGENIAPLLPATRFLDGLSYIGDEFVGCYVLETREGLIMFDATWNTEYHLNNVLKGFEDLDLDVKDVRYILITHGHSDHYGYAGRIRELSGAKILMSETDCELAKKQDTMPFPPMDFEPDQFIDEEDVVRLGEAAIHVYATPGHTPGSLSFIFDVYDEGVRHVASLWGGTGVTRAGLEECNIYIKEAIRFSQISDEMGVDVILQAHPFEINGKQKLEIVRNVFSQGVSNPFVIGREGARQFEKYLMNKAIFFRNKRLAEAKENDRN